ncbi:RnfH family protein [Kangiella sp. HD9-110m-PIT-SAG07]|nr:RnfH family protein [Kangiella sp. HD9-110m-PIT-SAG07]
MSDSNNEVEQKSREKISVEVCYALPEQQTLLKVTVDAETTLKDVIELSGILEQHKEIDLAENKVGVFSKPAKLDDTLHDGDRIEIYRPLLIDPKEVRKQRALKAQQEAQRADNKKIDKAGNNGAENVNSANKNKKES